MEGEVLFRTSMEICPTFAGGLQILPWLGLVSSSFCSEKPPFGESWTLPANFEPCADAKLDPTTLGASPFAQKLPSSR